MSSGSEAWTRIGCLTQTTRALGELARSRHTTVNTVLQAALGAAADVADRPARCRLRHRGLRAAQPSCPARNRWSGLLINTVPVRANITAATTTADLLDQLQHAHNHTLEHQHLALSEIHRVTGHDQLFDTLFVYENYPVDTTALSGAHELAITDVQHPRIHPLPADTGSPLGPANWAFASNTTPTCSTPASIQTLVAAVAAGAGGHDRRPRHGGCRRWMCSMPVSTPAWMSGATGRC